MNSPRLRLVHGGLSNRQFPGPERCSIAFEAIGRNLREGVSDGEGPILPMPEDGSNLRLNEPVIMWKQEESHASYVHRNLIGNMRGPVIGRMEPTMTTCEALQRHDRQAAAC